MQTQPVPSKEDRLYDDHLSKKEEAAMEFTRRYRGWQQCLWWVVNDNGYRSVEMERDHAEHAARTWLPVQGQPPFRAEPIPRPKLES